MPTVPSLPLVVTPASTDHVWLTQGTGADRDKKATLQQVIEGGFPAALAGWSAPSALVGTETLPLLQSGVAKEVTVTALLAEGLPSAVVSLTAPGELTGTESLPIVQSAAGKEMPLSSVFQVFDLDTSLITLKNQNNGVDATMAASIIAGYFRIGVSPGAKCISIDANLLLSGRSSSSTNANAVVVDFTAAVAALPAAAELILTGSGDFIKGAHATNYTAAGAAAIYPTWVQNSSGVLKASLLGASAPVRWQDIQPVNSTLATMTLTTTMLAP